MNDLIIFGDAELSYRFSEEVDENTGANRVQALFEKHNKEFAVSQYEKSLVSTRSWDMSHDKKWGYLAELSTMSIDWAKIVDDIYDAIINKVKIIN